MEKNKKTFLSKIEYVVAFMIPATIMIFSYAALGIYPGGFVTPLIFDLRAQQLAFFNYINNISEGFNSLSYQSLGALGGNVTNPLQMCCSPLFIIFKSIDSANIPWIIWGMIIFLVGLCGLSEYIYIKRGYPSLDNSYKALLISTSYSLMSCIVIYTLVPVWIFGMIFLPLIALGLDRCIDKNKHGLFIIAIALSIVINYYMAYILVIFSILYFFYRVLISNYPIKKIAFEGVKCFISGAISACISAFSWVPVLFDLSNGKIAESRSIDFGIIRNPYKVLLQILPMSYDGLLKHSLPYLFCGTLIVILVISFFCDKKISKRIRIVSLIILIILFLCFCIGILDVSWMFFSEPNGYPSRYSFVFSFFMLLFAAQKSKNISLVTRKRIISIITRLVLGIVIISELYLNSVYLLRSINEDYGPYSDYAEYVQLNNTMNKIKNGYLYSDFSGRTIKNWRYTNNDGILYGYEDIDYSSSGYNYALHSFLEQLGMNGQFHLIRSAGMTPVVASVLGVENVIQYGGSLEDYYTYIDSVDGLDIYHNENCLPLAFAVSNTQNTSRQDFSDNPFNNINAFMSDICGTEPIFEILPTVIQDNTVTTTPVDGEHLWMYARPLYHSADVHSDSNGNLYYVYDSDKAVDYANTISPYSVDLGIKNGEELTLSFNEDAHIQSVFLASYNIDLANKAIESIRNNSSYNVYSSGDGIIFDIDMLADGSIMLTKPYDKGYIIFVDGIKTDYFSYRDALISIPASSGHHEVVISYETPGGKIGFAISLVSLVFVFIIVVIREYKSIKMYYITSIKPILVKYYKIKIVLCFLLSFLLTEGCKVSLGLNVSLFGFLILVAIRFIIVYLFISYLYNWFDKCKCENTEINSRKVFLISFFVLVVLYFISFMGLYPGIFAFDAPYQVQMYFSNTISEWHPVLHTVFLGKMIEIAYTLGYEVMDGIALASVVQFVITALCFSYTLEVVYEKTGKKFVWIVSTIFLGSFPTISLQVLSATKDSFFMAFFVLSMTLTIEYITDNRLFIQRKYKVILWLLSTIIMIIMRNNCIYAIPVLILSMIIVSKNKKTTVLMSLCIFLMFLLYKFLYIPQYVSVEVDGREKLSLPAQQLTKIYLEDDSVLTSEERYIIERLINEKGRNTFIPASADAVKASINMGYYKENTSLIRKCYFDVILHNPQKAIETFEELTCGFWYPIYNLTLYGQGYKGYWVVGSFAPYYIESKIPIVLKFYSFFNEMDYSKILFVPLYVLFAPATFFYIFIVMFGYAIIKKKNTFIGVFLFILFYWMTYLLGPMVLVRYTTYLFAILPIYNVIIFNKE